MPRAIGMVMAGCWTAFYFCPAKRQLTRPTGMYKQKKQRNMYTGKENKKRLNNAESDSKDIPKNQIDMFHAAGRILYSYAS